MATFLTTSKMNPSLAARVERSVRGRSGSAIPMRRVIAIARVVLVLTLAFGIYSIVRGRRQERREFEQARSELLETVRTQSASVSADERAIVSRVESWLVPFSGAYEGDLVADELRAPGALEATLARPLVYVRGPIEQFTSGPRIAEASSTSTKDALLLCLMEPPQERSEKVLLDKVRAAYVGGSGMEQRTSNARRLNDAIVGLPLLLPPWSERVRNAADPPELSRLRSELARTPIERTKQAAKAELLVVAIDEPGDGKGPTELDGERPHPVRLALVDLSSAKPLLRMRFSVDPSWISNARKPTYASGLDSCALAFDVHQSVRRPASGKRIP